MLFSRPIRHLHNRRLLKTKRVGDTGVYNPSLLVREGYQSGSGSSTDGPSSWNRPRIAAEFTALSLAVPDYLWLCQEFGGDLYPVIGSGPLRASATPLYRQAVTGWTSKFVGCADNSESQGFSTRSAAFDVADGESFAVVALCSYATTNTRRLFHALGSTDRVEGNTQGQLRAVHNGVIVSGDLADSDLDRVRPIVWYRRADINASGVIGDRESLSNTHSEAAVVGGLKGIGGLGTGLNSRFTWLAVYKGTNAERDWSSYINVLMNNPLTVKRLADSSTSTDATSFLSSTINPAPNAAIYAACLSSKAVVSVMAPTASGCGLTWVEVATQVISTNKRLTLFRAMGASPTPGAVTFDHGVDTQVGFAYSILECVGVDTSGTHGSGATVQSKSATALSATTINVTLDSPLGSPNNAMLVFSAKSNNAAITADVDFSQRSSQTGSDGSVATEVAINQTACDPTGTSANWGIIAIEVKKAA